MMLDESFITALASVIFFSLSFKQIKKFLKAIADRKIQEVTERYNEAMDLKKESEKLLNDQKTNFVQLTQKAKDLINSTEEEIVLLKKRAELDLSNQLEYKNNLVYKQIHDTQEKFLVKMRLEALEQAINQAILIIKLERKNSSLLKLNKESLDNMSHLFK